MKSWRLILLIVISVLSISVSTEAATWERILGIEAGNVYIDIESISDGPEDSKEAWFLFKDDPPDCANEEAKLINKCKSSTVAYIRNFDNKTFCQLESAIYYTDGTNQVYTPACQPIRIFPGSVGDMMWNHIIVMSVEKMANWKYITSNLSGTKKIYIDSNSIKSQQDGTKKAWVKIDFIPSDCSSDFAVKINKCVKTNIAPLKFYNNKSFCSYGNIDLFTDGNNSGFTKYSCSPSPITPNNLMDPVWSYLFR